MSEAHAGQPRSWCPEAGARGGGALAPAGGLWAEVSKVGGVFRGQSPEASLL